ncbi:MAG: hypothetical protein HY246_07775 [Proteobacteria bacterium]|nr:hypothetical protein [Pseudomonadota bacterium]
MSTTARRRWLLSMALLLATLAACSRTPQREPQRPSVTASIVAGEDAAPLIEIVAINRLPLTSAELVDPAGATTPAARIERETLPTTTVERQGIGVGVSGGSSQGIEGVTIELPLFGSRRRPPPSPGLVRSRARLPILDGDAYALSWERSVVRLRFGTAPGETSLAEVPAPDPRRH